MDLDHPRSSEQRAIRRPVLRQGGKFVNPWLGSQFHSVLDFLKWAIVERASHRLPPQPSPDVFVRVAPSFPTPRAADDALVVTWVGHTSFLVQLGGKNILLDPVWGDRASPFSFVGPKRWVPPGVAFEALPPIDLVVISHDHYDHLDLPTVRKLRQSHPNAQWVAPLKVGEWLRRRGVTVIGELEWWESVTAHGITFTCTPAQHFAGRWPTNRNTTLWCGWTLRAKTGNVFFAGDTAYHPEFAAIAQELGPFDAAILPIGAYEPRWFMGAVHMDAAQAIDAYVDLMRGTTGQHQEQSLPEHPCTFIASHWGTFKLTDESMNEPPKLAREAWAKYGLPEDQLWIARHGETRRIPVMSAR